MREEFGEYVCRSCGHAIPMEPKDTTFNERSISTHRPKPVSDGRKRKKRKGVVEDAEE